MRIASWLASGKAPTTRGGKREPQAKHLPGPGPATGGTSAHSSSTAPISPRAIRIPARQVQRNRLKLRTFLNQLELVFLINPSRYNSEGIKVATGTLLTDVAASWFNPILENPHDNHATLNSWPAFKALLVNTSQEHVLHHEYPKTLEEFALLAIKVDARIQEHHLETQITWTRDHTQRQRTIPPHPQQNRYQQTPSQRLPPVSAPTNPMMMDLDATRRGPITLRNATVGSKENYASDVEKRDTFGPTLLDSGSDECLIDEISSTPITPTESPEKPPLRCSWPTVSQHPSPCYPRTQLKVTCQDHIEITKFYVSSIKYPVILGLDWLRRHNPRINWDDLTIVFRSEYVKTTVLQPASHVSFVEMTTCSTSRTDPDKLTSQVYPYIGGNEQQISDFPENLTIEYADVFSKSNANKLPAHSEFDFGIDLEPGFHPPHGNDMLGKFVLVYLDDIIIYSPIHSHVTHVREYSIDYGKNSCTASSRNASMASISSTISDIISSAGVEMDPKKIDAVQDWPVPTKVHDSSFLGFTNFYRRFVPNYAKTTQPLTALLKKDIKFDWNQATEDSFKALKKAFKDNVILTHADESQEFLVEVNASDFAVAGVLSQYNSQRDLQPVAFFSGRWFQQNGTTRSMIRNFGDCSV
ncbi:hypothetical protein BASA81_009976 [Batrachochytrium salamandrivorans]|nr:hypothetical protein BASA81_009976 [Batrachochytrium salamandrivorans]